MSGVYMSADNHNKENTIVMDDISASRLWKTLDDMTAKLGVIDTKLETVVRIEEQVNTHSEVIGRYGSRMDAHSKRIREVEIWQAGHNDQSDVVKELKEDVEEVVKSNNLFKGRKELEKSIFKWITGILGTLLTALLLYIFTGTG